jgi:hypothetical protein
MALPILKWTASLFFGGAFMYTDTMTWDTGTAGASPSGLLLEVDFKWLMAGQGRDVDPERLMHDPAYASGCLEFALHSPCAPLRACANRLMAVLGLNQI